MTTNPDSRDRFEPDSLDGLDERVRRYLGHALAPGERVSTRVRLTMTGRINVGRWLSFVAEQEFCGHEFSWRARPPRASGFRARSCPRRASPGAPKPTTASSLASTCRRNNPT
jgi:hypothetical protein